MLFEGGLGHDRVHRLAGGVRDRQPGHAQDAVGKALLVHGILDDLPQFAAFLDMAQQRQDLAIQRPGGVEVALVGDEIVKRHAHLRRHVGEHGDPAPGPHDEALVGQAFAAAQGDDVLAQFVDHPGDADHVARGLLEVDHVRQFDDFGHGLGGDVHRGAAGVVVDHDVDIDVFRDVGVKGVDFGLAEVQGRRREDHDGLGADGLGMLGEVHDGADGLGDRADHDRHAPGHFLDHEGGHVLAFLQGERGEFARGPERQQGMHPGVDEPVDVPRHGGIVDFAVLLEMGNGHGNDTMETMHRFLNKAAAPHRAGRLWFVGSQRGRRRPD